MRRDLLRLRAGTVKTSGLGARTLPTPGSNLESRAGSLLESAEALRGISESATIRANVQNYESVNHAHVGPCRLILPWNVSAWLEHVQISGVGETSIGASQLNRSVSVNTGECEEDFAPPTV